jgi:hypothetical protein
MRIRHGQSDTPGCLLERSQANIVFLAAEIGERQRQITPSPFLLMELWVYHQRSTGKNWPIPASREGSELSVVKADIRLEAGTRRDWTRLRARAEGPGQILRTLKTMSRRGRLWCVTLSVANSSGLWRYKWDS